MTELEKEEYIDYVKHKIFFYIETGFWSKPSMTQLQKWFKNFESVDEKYCAAKLLDNFVFYSEDDIIRLLKYGFEEVIFRKHVMALDIESDFEASENEVTDLKSQFISKTALLPLAIDNPSDSAFWICRHFTNDLGFPEEQVLSVSSLTREDLNMFDRILLIDDFIGTGDQIIDFWNYKRFIFEGKEMPLYQIKDECEAHFEYLCIVATSAGYTRFVAGDVGFRNDLPIHSCEKLTDNFIVFGSGSVYYEEPEMDYCKSILKELCSRKGINLLGHNGYNYAVGFHHSIPDSSLPLFYTQSKNWNYLFRNKLTKDGL